MRKVMDDMEFMGTMEQAQATFLVSCERWRILRQPHVANAAAHKRRDAEESEARFRLANDALLLAWHMNNASNSPPPQEVKEDPTTAERMKPFLKRFKEWSGENDAQDTERSRIWHGKLLEPYTVDMDDIYAADPRGGRYMISQREWLTLPFSNAVTPQPEDDPTCSHGKPLHQDCFACEEGGRGDE